MGPLSVEETVEKSEGVKGPVISAGDAGSQSRTNWMCNIE
jgi:hypothetical protein